MADTVRSLGGIVAATGPDVRNGPGRHGDDPAQATRHVFCRPARLGGSGETPPRTPRGDARAALRCHRQPAAVRHREPAQTDAGWRDRPGNVGTELARLLKAEGAALTVTDVDQDKRKTGHELGATTGSRPTRSSPRPSTSWSPQPSAPA
ncbi:hypothetical protein LT493_16730 [Streptomyces tricolor]|nr:hypothetical protein [Streptomyces tricolor]